jgi:hypothetical protein
MVLLPKEEGKGRLKETKITLKRTFVRKQLSLAVSSGEKRKKTIQLEPVHCLVG